MEYTDIQRKTIHRHLVAALTTLPTCYPGRRMSSPYICDNVLMAGHRDETAITRNMIRQRLGGYFSLDRWLKDQSPEISREVGDDVLFNQGRKLQAHRRAWLKQLIAEFQTNGN